MAYKVTNLSLTSSIYSGPFKNLSNNNCYTVHDVSINPRTKYNWRLGKYRRAFYDSSRIINCDLHIKSWNATSMKDESSENIAWWYY